MQVNLPKCHIQRNVPKYCIQGNVPKCHIQGNVHKYYIQGNVPKCHKQGNVRKYYIQDSKPKCCIQSNVPNTTYKVMYLSANRFANLALTKAVLQLLFLEVHSLNMRPRGDIFF